MDVSVGRTSDDWPHGKLRSLGCHNDVGRFCAVFQSFSLKCCDVTKFCATLGKLSFMYDNHTWIWVTTFLLRSSVTPPLPPPWGKQYFPQYLICVCLCVSHNVWPSGGHYLSPTWLPDLIWPPPSLLGNECSYCKVSSSCAPAAPPPCLSSTVNKYLFWTCWTQLQNFGVWLGKTACLNIKVFCVVFCAWHGGACRFKGWLHPSIFYNRLWGVRSPSHRLLVHV